MAKSELTIQLERDIWKATNKQGVFGCFEVTIGWFGCERVDYITYDTKGIWRCYEIKISKSDFNSKAHNTFIGHFNYYVMPKELYEQVKSQIPSHIGVYIGTYCIKKAKRQELIIDEQTLKNSLIRSLYREVDKQIRSDNPLIVESLRRQLRNKEKELQHFRQQYYDLNREIVAMFGTRWRKQERSIIGT